MGNPVIFDDGGSLRIRRELYEGVQVMNDLLRVQHKGRVPHSSDILEGPFARITGISICADGTPQPVVDGTLIAGDHFTIHAANHQALSGTIDNAGRCTITVSGGEGNPPVVESGVFDGVQRFHVVNAGPIRRVDGTASGTAFHFETAACKSIYTALILRCVGGY